MIYVYLFDGMERLGADFTSENIHLIPEFRQKYCLGYRMETDKKACIVAWLLLQKGLREQYGLCGSLDVRVGEHGKPYLRYSPEIHFNISHCRNGVACAISEMEIGIDIQDVRPYDARIARRVCTDAELESLAACEYPERLFCRLWTQKESYAKANGMSLMSVFKTTLPQERIIHWCKGEYFMALGISNAENAVLSKTQNNGNTEHPVASVRICRVESL